MRGTDTAIPSGDPTRYSRIQARRACAMSTELTVRSAQTEDIQAWLTLWRGYCAALDGPVSDEVTERVWQRILASDEPIWCLLACRSAGEPVGFANYILHPHTWSL